MSPCGEPAQGPFAMDMTCKFNKLKPPKFQGGVDPLRYEEWMWRLETYLKLWTAPLDLSGFSYYLFEGEA